MPTVTLQESAKIVFATKKNHLILGFARQHLEIGIFVRLEPFVRLSARAKGDVVRGRKISARLPVPT
jgi:hypothetical protein